MNFIRGLISFCLSGILFLIVLLAVLSYIVGLILNERVIQETIESANLLTLTVGDLPEFVVIPQNMDLNPDNTVLDSIYEIAAANGSTLSKDEIEEIYQHSNLDQLLSSQLAGAAGYLMTGASPPTLGEEELNRILGDNIKIIKITTGIELSDADIEELGSVITYVSTIADGVKKESAADSSAEQSNLRTTIIKYAELASPKTLAIAALIIAGLIFFINIGQVKSAAGWLGVTGFASGAVIFGLSNALYNGRLLLRFGIPPALLRSLTSAVASNLFWIGAAIGILGILFIIYSLVKKT